MKCRRPIHCPKQLKLITRSIEPVIEMVEVFFNLTSDLEFEFWEYNYVMR